MMIIQDWPATVLNKHKISFNDRPATHAIICDESDDNLPHHNMGMSMPFTCWRHIIIGPYGFKTINYNKINKNGYNQMA